MQRTGWAQSLGPDDTAELAEAMAAETLEAGADYPLGTRLYPAYDHNVDGWVYTQ